jgi:hypothetical protein
MVSALSAYFERPLNAWNRRFLVGANMEKWAGGLIKVKLEGKPVGPFATFEECVDRMGQEPGVDDPEAFCGWLEQQSGTDEGEEKMEPETGFKTFTLELKEDGEDGEFVAKIATLEVIDRDRDVTLPGAFPEGKTIHVSSFNHSSWNAPLPVGVATIHEEGKSIFASGRFNLATEAGREHHSTLKFAKEHGVSTEWSYGYQPTEFSFGLWENQQVRFLEKVDVFEISPVMKGAGIDTQTLLVKSSQTFQAHAEAVLAAASELVARAKSLADLRAKDKRGLSAANRKRLESLLDRVVELDMEVRSVLEASEEEREAIGKSLWLEYQKTMALINSA